jgi:hypothetical protein
LKERIIEGWAGGAAVAEMAKPFRRGEAYDNFIHGERYILSPELVKRFLKALPIAQIPKRYVQFRPLADVDPAMETPQTGVSAWRGLPSNRSLWYVCQAAAGVRHVRLF